MRSPKTNGQILKVGLFRGHLPLSRGQYPLLEEKNSFISWTIPKLEEKGDAKVKEGTSIAQIQTQQTQTSKTKKQLLRQQHVLLLDLT